MIALLTSNNACLNQTARIYCVNLCHILSLCFLREEYFIKHFSLLIFNLFFHHFTIFQFNMTSSIEKIMLASADSREFGYQTRNCIYSRTLMIPRRQIRNRASSTTSSRCGIVKSNEAIEIPFPGLCATSSRSAICRTYVFCRRILFSMPWPIGWEVQEKRDEAMDKKKKEKRSWCDQSWNARARCLTPATL